MTASERPLRAGVAGFGRMGALRARAAARHPRLELVAVADPVFASSDAPSSGLGCTELTSGEALLEQGLDVLFVATPNDIMCDLVVSALDAGVHVFCEKPPGRTVADVKAMIAAEARSGAVLKFGFNHRYHDAIIEALEVVRAGTLGSVICVRGLYGKGWTEEFLGEWRSDHRRSGGGILLDQGIHMVDLFRAFCGDFVEVRSFIGSTRWELPVEDNAFALLRTAGGTVAMLHSSATHWKHTFALEVFMSEGYVSVNGFLTGSRSYGRETLTVARRAGATGRPSEEVSHFDHDASWNREVAEFVRCVSEGVPVAVGSSHDALSVMRLVRDIYDADPSWSPAVSLRSGAGS